MDHDRKRQIRLVIALTVAVLLAVALIYTSFNAGTEAREPSDVLAQGPSNETYQLTGEVTDYKREGSDLGFDITDRDGGAADTAGHLQRHGARPVPRAAAR